MFVILGTWYANVTPFRTGGKLHYQAGIYQPDIGAPDERQHVNYVAKLRSTGQLLVFNPKDPNLYESYQSHQPPLFYLLAAPVFGNDGSPIRYLNIVVGVFTLLGLYAFGLWASESPEFGLTLAAFGLMPMHIALCSAVSNDPLLFCLIQWCLAFCVRASKPTGTVRDLAWTGVFSGLAILTKSSAVALLPILLILPFFLSKELGIRRFIPLSVAIILGVPWWLRNSMLYGDPLGMRVFSEAFQGSAQASMFISAFGAPAYWENWVLWWTSRSFVGAFGYMDLFLPNNVYLIAFAILFLLACGWLMMARDKIKVVSKPAVVFSAVVGFLFLVLFWRFNSQYFQAQARYLYPALSAWALLFGGGCYGLLRSRSWWALLGTLAIANALILMWMPGEFQTRIVEKPILTGQ